MTVTVYRPRKYLGFTTDSPRIAEARSSDKYGSGRTGVWDPNFPTHLTDKWRRQGWRVQRTTRNILIYSTPNGFNDPLSVALVTDLLLRLEPGTYLNANILENILSSEYPSIRWDSVTVGRIMRALTAESMLTERTNDQEPPIVETRWSGGRVYMLNPSPANHNWLGQVREYFGKLAEQHVAEWNEGGSPDRTGQIWADVTTLPWGVSPA